MGSILLLTNLSEAMSTGAQRWFTNAAIFACPAHYIPEISPHPRFRRSTIVQTVTN